MSSSGQQHQFGIDFSGVKSIPEDPKVRLDYFRKFKDLLLEMRLKIQDWHRQGAGGREVVQAHTGLVDEAIKQVVVSLNDLPAYRGKNLLDKFTLVAVGGYGRGELNPCSDIDLLFLYQKKMDRSLDNFIQDIISVLWGIGLEIGQSCRTLKDCKTLALEDSTVRTSMVEMRFLTGAHSLYQKLWATIRKSVLKKKSKEFLNTHLKDFHDRAEADEGVTGNPEPDLKNGPGGLRDYHLVQWAVAVCFEGRSVREINREDIVAPQEVETLDESVDFLLRVRNELHYLKNKKTDALDLEIQKTLARNLNYPGPNANARVESFMRDYFMHATAIRQISDDIFHRCVEAKPSIQKVISNLGQKKLGDGFVVRRTQLGLSPKNEAAIPGNPEILLEVFRHCMSYDLKPDPHLKKLIRENLSLLDADFIRQKPVREFLAEVLDHPHSETTLRLMHEMGVLGKLLPEFGQTLFQVNYDFYHRYTTDEHSLRMIHFLEELESVSEEGAERLKAVYAQVPGKMILKLACLHHTLGEAQQVKGQDILQILEPIHTQMRLTETQRDTLKFLIENMNTMNEVAFHQDIHQPNTIRLFAEEIQSVDRLNLALLISYVELKAVAPGTWTAWKKILLLELYHRTLNFLIRPESLDEKPQATRAAVFSILDQEIVPEVIVQHLQGMSEDYLLTADSKNVAEHIRLIQQLEDKPFVLHSDYNSNGGYYDLTLCVPNKLNLLINLVGTLTAKALNILGAQIYAREDNIAIITLQVDDKEIKNIHGDASKLWDEIKNNLEALFEKRVTLHNLLRDRTRLTTEKKTGEALVPRIHIENFQDNPFTFIRIEARDHPGMLYKIVHTFAKFGIELHRAKIATQGGRGIDVFSISLRGKKIHFSPLLRRIKEMVIYALLVEKLEDLT